MLKSLWCQWGLSTRCSSQHSNVGACKKDIAFKPKARRRQTARGLDKPLNLVCGGMQWALVGETREHDHRYPQLFAMSEWCTCLRRPQACPQLANYRASLKYDSYNLIYFVLLPLCPTGCVVHSHSADQDQQE